MTKFDIGDIVYPFCYRKTRLIIEKISYKVVSFEAGTKIQYCCFNVKTGSHWWYGENELTLIEKYHSHIHGLKHEFVVIDEYGDIEKMDYMKKFENFIHSLNVDYYTSDEKLLTLLKDIPDKVFDKKLELQFGIDNFPD